MSPPADLSRTRDISVIIATNLDQRFEWLRHRLNFLYHHGFQGEVLVGVWAGHDRIDALLSFCLSLSLNIRVIAQDGADRFTARVLAMAEQATGKYLLQSGDDDFLLPGPLATIAQLLESDPSVFSAQGRTILLDTDLVHPDYRIYTFPQWPAPEPELLTRYAQYFKHPGQTFYAVFRRTDFVERCRHMDETMARTKNLVWFELATEFFTVIKGRFVVVDEIYMLRGTHSNNTSNILRRDFSDEMFPFLLFADHFSPTYKVFEEQIFHLFSACGVDPIQPEVRRIILQGFVDYLGVLIYKLRGPTQPEELALAALLTQSPAHPVTRRLIDMVIEARLPDPGLSLQSPSRAYLS